MANLVSHDRILDWILLLCCAHLQINPSTGQIWTGSASFSRQALKPFRGGWIPYKSSARNVQENEFINYEVDFHASPPFGYNGEVVGLGRMGSFWLINSNVNNETKKRIGTTITCPRGISPGCLSLPNSPIFVAVPSGSWSQIYNETVPDRRQDLVFVGNGIPRNDYKNCTVVVPHFAVLQICRDTLRPINHIEDNSKQMISHLATNDLSPPTWIYGKHAQRTQDILKAQGVKTQIVQSFAEIQVYAGLKVLWASCFWLLCHSNENRKLTVGQVHDCNQQDLDKLVDELYPAFQRTMLSMNPLRSTENSSQMESSSNDQGFEFSRRQVDDYLQNYSNSIADAIPNKNLALSEFYDRNAVWFHDLYHDRQPFHFELLKQHIPKEEIERITKQPGGHLVNPLVSNMDRVRIELDDTGLVAWGYKDEQFSHDICHPRNVVVVGGGIIGTCIAFYLAKRRPDWNITLLDEMTEIDYGRTTKASWAWLNANNKQPKSYQSLNQLGIHTWKREKNLNHLASWLGSLVRFPEFPEFVNDGGYPVEGPLRKSRIRELEPMSNWQVHRGTGAGGNESGYTFFFPDEGCVDPSAAVRTMRKAAKKLGVQIKCGKTATDVIKDDDNGRVKYVKISSSDGLFNAMKRTSLIPADLVVAAAGCGVKSTFLGGTPLLHRPGRIEYAIPKLTLNARKQPVKNSRNNRLRRILVDSERCSHILQRSNGDIVAGGGGRLEFGGEKSSMVTLRDKLEIEQMDEALYKPKSLLSLAQELAPSIVKQSEFTHSYHAIRPMPLDGLPVVGYSAQGLYTVVSHSGITLGPLLAALAAGEIADGVSLDILRPYRPTRFH